MKASGVRRHRAWIALALFAATMALYAPTSTHGFVNYDDPDYVKRGGLTADGVAWALRSTEAANWFPLTRLSHLLDVQLFGMNPGPHHLVNAGLHALAAALLFLALARMTGTVWRAGFVAAVFALHPLHVESVAWIAERKDVLAGVFWSLALLAYARYADRPSAGRYALVAAAFAGGLMSKPTVVTLPVVLLLLDVWPLRRRAWREKLPLFAMAAALSVVVFVVQWSSGAVVTASELPLGMRVANALVQYVVYAAKLVWPSGLAVFYPFAALPLWAAVAAAAGLAAVSALAWRERTLRPWLLVGWCWYLATLLPTIGVVQVGLQARADRYTYLPLTGLAIVLAWGLAEWLPPRAAAAIGVAACAGWAGAAWSQVSVWRDSTTLFEHALAVTSGNYVAENNLGVALRDRGEIAEAIRHFEAAVAIRPGFGDAHSNLGESLLRAGRIDEAARHIEAAVRLEPETAAAHVNTAALLSRQGRIAEAATDYREAVGLDPSSAEAHGGLGTMDIELGKLDEAGAELREAVRLKPDYADGHYNLGRLHGLSGRAAEAATEFAEVVRLRPDDAEARFNLGTAYATLDRLGDAIDQLREAVRLRPDYAKAHFNLGSAYAVRGDCGPAVPEFAAALRLGMAEARAALEACGGLQK